MTDTSKISKRQLMFLIFVSRATIILNGQDFLGVKISAAEYVLSTAAGVTFLCVLGLFLKKSSLPTRLSNGGFFKALSVLIYFIAMVETAFILRRLFENLYGGVEPVAFAVILAAAAACYALTRGIEGTARLSAVIALLVMVSVLFTLLPNITNFKAASLTPVYDVTGTGLCAAFIRQFIFFPELLLFVSLSGSANEEINLKSIVKFTVFSSVTIAFFFIFSEGVLGSGVFLDRLNISALSQTGELSIFKRLDSFRLCLWVVVCASRLAAFGEGISFAFCNDRLKHKDNRNTTAAFVIIAVSALFGCIAGVKLPSEIMTAAVSVLMVVTFIVLSISAAGRKSNG